MQCKHCPQQYKHSGGTRNTQDHLTKFYGWVGFTNVEMKQKKEYKDITQVINRMGPIIAEKNQAARKQILRDYLDRNTYEYLYIWCVILCNLPFQLVEIPVFQSLLQYINPVVNKFLLDSHNTIRS